MKNKATQPSLPKHGYSRAKDLLPFLPFGITTLWNWSKCGKFPKPIKLGQQVTAWDNQEVHAWFAAQKQQNTTDAANDAVIFDDAS